LTIPCRRELLFSNKNREFSSSNTRRIDAKVKEAEKDAKEVRETIEIANKTYSREFFFQKPITQKLRLSLQFKDEFWSVGDLILVPQ
jgi:hypothetical protein